MKSLHRQRLVVALTGGIGCGKSTAARLFAAAGWERLDSDEVIHQQIFVNVEVQAKARDLFGPEAVSDSGLDRRLIAQNVFSDPAKLQAWEAVIHPRLLALWAQAFALATDVPLVVEVPLLFEKGLEKGFDFTVCVATSSSLQLARLEERGLTRALAEQRISRQWPLSRKMDLSHFVLSNDGSPSFLQAQVDHLSRAIVARR